MKVIVSGGGTGGHIFPAVAVAQEIKKRDPSVELLFVGAKGKMEMIKVPKAGFKIKGLWISGFHRSLTFRNLLFPFKLIVSFFQSFGILYKFKPDVVAGFGGYASGAALWMASKMGKPTLIMEQNSYPGMTNKLLNGKADVVCIAYEEAAKYFTKSRTVLTGNPIRSKLRSQLDQTACKETLGLDLNKKTILMIGGSLGARSINLAFEGSYDRLKQIDDIQFIWQCGGGYIDQYKDGRVSTLEHVHLTAFIEDMATAYTAADLVVCRAGALSIAEVMCLGKASILIPSPNVAEDHQSKNAAALVDKGAAVLLKDKHVDQLVEKAVDLLEDEKKLEIISKNASSMFLDNSAERIVDELYGLLKERNNG